MSSLCRGPTKPRLNLAIDQSEMQLLVGACSSMAALDGHFTYAPHTKGLVQHFELSSAVIVGHSRARSGSCGYSKAPWSAIWSLGIRQTLLNKQSVQVCLRCLSTWGRTRWFRKAWMLMKFWPSSIRVRAIRVRPGRHGTQKLGISKVGVVHSNPIISFSRIKLVGSL